MIKRTGLILFICCMTFFCGCGKDKKLEEYNEAITTFNANVAEITSTMENIDTGSESAEEELLVCLDRMQTEFEGLAALEVPSKFSSVESLADEAGTYMTEAVSLYHEVFEAEEFQEEKANAANENYSRAMKRISYISSLLKGELPKGDDIEISEEDALDFAPIEEE